MQFFYIYANFKELEFTIHDVCIFERSICEPR